MLMFWQQQIEGLNQKIEQSSQRITDYLGFCASLFNHGKLNGEQLPNYFGKFLQDSYLSTQSYLEQQPLEIIGSWQDYRWENWNINDNLLSSLEHTELIRIGQLVEQRSSNNTFCVPEFAPFIGGNKTIIIRCSNNATSQ